VHEGTLAQCAADCEQGQAQSFSRLDEMRLLLNKPRSQPWGIASQIGFQHSGTDPYKSACIRMPDFFPSDSFQLRGGLPPALDPSQRYVSLGTGHGMRMITGETMECDSLFREATIQTMQGAFGHAPVVQASSLHLNAMSAPGSAGFQPAPERDERSR
jgi:hypothetical protein